MTRPIKNDLGCRGEGAGSILVSRGFTGLILCADFSLFPGVFFGRKCCLNWQNGKARKGRENRVRDAEGEGKQPWFPHAFGEPYRYFKLSIFSYRIFFFVLINQHFHSPVFFLIKKKEIFFCFFDKKLNFSSRFLMKNWIFFSCF